MAAQRGLPPKRLSGGPAVPRGLPVRLRHISLVLLAGMGGMMLWTLHYMMDMQRPMSPTAADSDLAPFTPAYVAHDLQKRRQERVGWPASTDRARAGLPPAEAAEYSLPLGTGPSTTAPDTSQRCIHSKICDDRLQGCGASRLGCVQDAEERRRWIVEATRASWGAYREHAWGHDELAVASKGQLSHMDWLGMGLTIIDSLGSLLLMNLTAEYQAGRDWVVHAFDLDHGLPQASVFEVNIRILGGLLSAFSLTEGRDTGLLRKAVEVADRMLPAFENRFGIAELFLDFSRRKSPSSSPQVKLEVPKTNVAAAGTFTLELTTLSRLTGDRRYVDAATKFWTRVHRLHPCNGLVCTWFEPDIMQCSPDPEYGFGSSADSMYEYMLKHWVMTGGQAEGIPASEKRATRHSPPVAQDMLEMYRAAAGGLRAHLVVQVQQKPIPRRSYGRTIRTAGRGPASKTSFWDQPFWLVGMGSRSPSGGPMCPRSYTPHGDDNSSDAAAPAAADGGRGAGQWGQAADAAPAVQPSLDRRSLADKAGKDAAEPGAHGVVGRSRLWLRGTQATGAGGHQRDLRMSSQPMTASAIEAAAIARNPPINTARKLQHFACFTPGLLTLGHLFGLNTATHHPPSDPLTCWAGVRRPGVGQRTSRLGAWSRWLGWEDGSDDGTAGACLPPIHPPEALAVDDLKLAVNLMRGCYELYRASPSGVAGDILEWMDLYESADAAPFQWPMFVDQKNYLRPEVVESLFYLWRATHDPVWREWGWNIFRAFHQSSRLRNGAYVTLESAVTSNPVNGDRMESFWLAETLKYFYLLFSDDPNLLPLSDWVINTEAHPLPIWGSVPDKTILRNLGRNPPQHA